MLQNIITTPIDAKLYRFTAAPGYRLFDRAAQVYRPEAITDLKTAKKQLEAKKETQRLRDKLNRIRAILEE